MTNTVLIVEDEVKLATLLSEYFIQSNYDTKIIHHGDEVTSWLRQNSVLAVLLDIMLPGTDGISLCQQIRQFSTVPILMVTAKVDETDRLLGLDIGADDYICKPFSPREVVARVKAILRRSPTQNLTAPSKTISLNETHFTLTLQNQQVQLTSIEFQLLQSLIAAPGRIFSREQLMDIMYNDYRVVNQRTIDSHIKKLRKKLNDISAGEELIQSVYGIGYRFNQAYQCT